MPQAASGALWLCQQTGVAPHICGGSSQTEKVEGLRIVVSLPTKCLDSKTFGSTSKHLFTATLSLRKSIFRLSERELPTLSDAIDDATMSERDSPVGEHANEPVNDGQEQEYEDAVAAADSDRDSDALSEVDEDQFEDYDPETANIENRPVDIDEDVARTLKATKRKRTEGEAPKKPREGRRDKKRRDRDEDVEMDDADDGSKKSRRSRRAGGDGERRPKSKATTPEPENEDHLSPEERRKRAIDRALDAAIKKPSGQKRKKRDEIVSVLIRVQGGM